MIRSLYLQARTKVYQKEEFSMKQNAKHRLPALIKAVMTALIMSALILPASVYAEETVPSTVTTENSGPVITHVPQAYTLDCATNVVMNVTTGVKVGEGLNSTPILFPGDTVRFIPKSGHDHAWKGFVFTPANPLGHATAHSFACKDDGKVHVLVTETAAWGEPNESSGENLYITAIEIVGEEAVRLQSWGGGDYTGVPATETSPKLSYTVANLEFVYIPGWCRVTTELWYSFNQQHLMTEEEKATAAFYDDEPDTTVVWAEDGYANSVAESNGEEKPVLLKLRRPYIEGYRFGEANVWPRLDTNQVSEVYGRSGGPNWHGNYWEGWIDNVIEFYPKLDNWAGSRTGYTAYGAYEDELLYRFLYYPCRTLTLDACGGTIDGYPTRIYEAADCRQYWDKDLSDGVVDAEYADGEKYIPVREGYIFCGWYEDSGYTTPVTSFKETLNKFSTNPYDPAERHICRMYAKWMKESQITLADRTVEWTGQPAAMDGAVVTGSAGAVSYRYYADPACSSELDPGEIIAVGNYYVKAFVEEDAGYLAAESDPAVLTIAPISIGNATVAGVSLSYGYSGKAYTPALTVKVNGVTLTQGTDYKAVYRDNKDPGTATITITGMGNYTGTKIKKFAIIDCVSSLVSGKTYQLIPKNNSATAVCSYSGKMVNNTKVYITDRSSSEAMRFVARKNSDGTWKFINAKCELALAVQQNSSEAGKGLVLYDQTEKAAQNWRLSRKSDNSFAIINAVSGKCIAMSDITAVKGTTLSIAEPASSGLQRFYIAETDAVSAPFDGTYAVRASANKSFALNIASSSKADGANVNLNTYSNVNAKKFRIMYSGGEYYRLVNVNSGMCLTVSGNSKTNGANVVQSKWAALSGQRWKITKNSDGTVTLKNALGTVLHLVSNSAKNGTNIVAKTASSTKAQRWYLG